MKKVSNILAQMEASLNGSLDGLEFDNTDDVIEKSTVIEMVKDLKIKNFGNIIVFVDLITIITMSTTPINSWCFKAKSI
jgi:hypothetical protein